MLLLVHRIVAVADWCDHCSSCYENEDDQVTGLLTCHGDVTVRMIVMAMIASYFSYAVFIMMATSYDEFNLSCPTESAGRFATSRSSAQLLVLCRGAGCTVELSFTCKAHYCCGMPQFPAGHAVTLAGRNSLSPPSRTSGSSPNSESRRPRNRQSGPVLEREAVSLLQELEELLGKRAEVECPSLPSKDALKGCSPSPVERRTRSLRPRVS